MTPARIAALLSFVLTLGACPGASAETDKGDVAAGPVSQVTTPPGVIVPLDDPDEIVVTADRRGEARVAAETEFSEEEIAAQGADSIQDLLTRLAPFIDGSGEEPVILINGKPAGFDRSILSYPAEALDRLAVLKPEAAAQYGEPAGKRVVNLVLKKNFSALNADMSANFATAGGQYGGGLSVGRTAISGETRWNVQARVSGDSALLRSARNLPPREGIFDSVGLVSAPDGGELDPALSLAAGTPVTVAAIPAGATSGIPSLSDFISTANMVNSADPDRYDTLQPMRRAASMAVGVTRPLGDFSVALNLNVNRTRSEGLRGLPMASLTIPAGNTWSPFASDILLTRPFANERALHNDNGATSLAASLTLNGSIGSWQTNLSFNYARNRASSLLERGIDVAAIQRLIDAGDPGFNPYGPLDADLLLSSRTRSRGENLRTRLNVRKTIVDLPAGPLVWNITASAAQNRSRNHQIGAMEELDRDIHLARRQVDGEISFSLPVSRREEDGRGGLGDLNIDLSASVQKMTKSGSRQRFAGNMSWSPWPSVQFRGSIDYAETAPSFDQLDAPVEVRINRIFDYARQEVAEPVWTTGGNPDLRRGSRQGLSLSAMVRPLGDQTLTLNLGYRQSIAKGGVAGFPELTPAIEAAFPERVTRDAEGRLVAVDARPINIAHHSDADVSTNIAVRLGQVRGRGRGEATADPLQFGLSVNHRWRLKSELLTRSGVPVIDQLRAGGQSRHVISVQASVAKKGIGVNLNGNWSSPGRLRGEEESFAFKPPVTVNLSAFVEPDRLFDAMGKKGTIRGVKLSMDVDNLFDRYRRVTREDGTVPAGYYRNEIDPLGRTVRLTLRKKF